MKKVFWRNIDNIVTYSVTAREESALMVVVVERVPQSQPVLFGWDTKYRLGGLATSTGLVLNVRESSSSIWGVDSADVWVF